jgi:predicted ATPase
MYLSKFQIFNYKSFFDSGMMEFKAGINIITGQNNSGTTALLEALTLNFQNIPHRSIKTLPDPSFQIEGESMSSIILTFDKSELPYLFEQIYPLWIPSLQHINDMNPISIFTDWVNSSGGVELAVNLRPSLSFDETDNALLKLNFNLYPTPNITTSSQTFPCLNIRRKKSDVYENYEEAQQSLSNTVGWRLFNHFRSRIYRFYAERLNIGKCGFGSSTELAQNASNLAQVLIVMQAENSARFNRFNDLVSTIFPYIKRIAIKPLPTNELEIMVWTIDEGTERSDLACPISACGTGIGQVLSILYVVINSTNERVIIIDEPQSFLHPGAAKKLIEILRTQFSQHQYFISTHSPTIIAASNPSSVVMLQYKDCESVASVMNAQDNKQLRLLLDDIGVSLSDVFGADNILWVEGQTEEKCFPLILERIGKKPLMGTTIRAVNATGDFETKKKKGDYAANRVFEIYKKLSGKDSLVPPAIAFVFDREFKDEARIKEMKKLSENLAQFTGRTMYENYLLDPEAIANIINEDDTRDKPLSNNEVSEWIKTNSRKEEYYPSINCSEENLNAPKWIENNIHAARLLDNLFIELTDSRVEYRKTKHSFKITEWLIDNNPSHLSELSDFLIACLTEN